MDKKRKPQKGMGLVDRARWAWHLIAIVSILILSGPVVWGEESASGELRFSSLLMEDGTFVPFNEKGDMLPDFSAVGYHSGARDMRPGLADGLPVIEVALGGENQDAQRINQALEKAAGFPLLEDGYRAVVRLAPGTYRLEGSILMQHSGVILLGPAEGEPAVLTYLPKEQGTALRIGDRSMPQIVREQAVAIATDYVPVGSHRIPVEETSGFRVGDRVIVEYDCNAEWISVLGMDRIPPRYENRGGRRVNVIQQWQPEEYIYSALRVVVAIEENELVLDAPTVMALDARYGDTVVGPYTHDAVIENIGLAYLEIVSDYDPSVTTPNRWVVNPTEPVYADENHGAWAISVNAARNGWVYQVTARHFVQGCVTLNAASSHFTVSHCRNLDPVSRIDGGRRYSFNVGGQRHLVKHCYARGGRHDYVTPSRVPGPNVFYDCLAEEAYNGSEPHHRMTKGVLFDNVRVWGPGACMAVLNRTNNGTGHGWMGAQIVFWNCASPLILVQQPPIGQNFAIGVSEPYDRTMPEFINNMERRIRMTNLRSDKEFEFQGTAFVGDGHFESPDAPVLPRSLYQFQLQQRLAEQ